MSSVRAASSARWASPRSWASGSPPSSARASSCCPVKRLLASHRDGGELALAALLYDAVALVMTGLVSYTELNVPDPLSIALGAHPNLDWLRNPANAAAVAGLAAGVVSLLYG